MDMKHAQRGFFAVGIALAIVAGFGLGGMGLVELAEGDGQVVAMPAEAPAAVAANPGDGAGAN
jgi:hypothetical protein